MTAQAAEPEAIRILREIIHGDDAQLPAALEKGRTLLQELPAAYSGQSKPMTSIQCIGAIINLVARRHGYTGAKLLSKDRTRELVHARMIAMCLCREMTGASMQRVAKLFKFGHHGTVMHARRTVADYCATNKSFADLVEELRKEARVVCGRATT